MKISRRTIARNLMLASVIGIPVSRSTLAFAETYEYDARGRLVRVTYPDDQVVEYTYDAAGNRLEIGSSGGGGFTESIAITGSSSTNLRTLANTAGYNGAEDATITFTLASGVTISGAAGNDGPGGVAISTGTWPTSLYAIALTLQISGGVNGGGGGGGDGGGFYTAGSAGSAGGHAINCEAPINIIVNSGGAVRGGGGGGGGGRGSGSPLYRFGGGGGGGGATNGHGGGGGPGDLLDGQAGNNGTSGGGGSGGAPGGSGAAAGGAGGGFGSAGVSGGTGGGAAGGAGYAIRKNGHTVPVTNNGTITGTVG
jgi:YD repeat-containing protein